MAIEVDRLYQQALPLFHTAPAENIQPINFDKLEQLPLPDTTSQQTSETKNVTPDYNDEVLSAFQEQGYVTHR